MPYKSIKNISITKTSGTLPKSKSKTYQNLTSLWAAFRASLFPSLEREAVSAILEELCSLTSPESLKLNNLAYYSLKTSKGYSLTMKGELLPQSSPRLMSWGMTSNGKCLTARILESPRIVKECSLLEILEERPAQNFSFGEKMVEFRTRNRKTVFPEKNNPRDTGGVSPTITARYWKMGKTDPFISTLSGELKEKEKNG